MNLSHGQSVRRSLMRRLDGAMDFNALTSIATFSIGFRTISQTVFLDFLLVDCGHCFVSRLFTQRENLPTS